MNRKIALHIFGKVKCSLCKGLHTLTGRKLKPITYKRNLYYEYHTSCGGYYESKNPNLKITKK